MEANLKAKELFEKYDKNVVSTNYRHISKEAAKQCALLAVDLVINQWEYIDTYLADANGELNPNLKYWYEVKKEIINYETRI